MLAQFSIWPLDTPHMSKEVTEVTQVLDQLGVNYQVGPLGTTVEGEWQDVMEAIQACHQMVRQEHQRVLTNVTIDDDTNRTQTMAESTAKVTLRQEVAGRS